MFFIFNISDCVFLFGVFASSHMNLVIQESVSVGDSDNDMESDEGMWARRVGGCT